MQANDLERAVVLKLLDDPDFQTSRRAPDWNSILVKRRNLSAVGFLTEFERSGELKLFDDGASLRWAGVGARLNASGTETGYLVYVDDGYVTAVEGYTYCGEEWPTQVLSIEWYDLKRRA